MKIKTWDDGEWLLSGDPASVKNHDALSWYIDLEDAFTPLLDDGAE